MYANDGNSHTTLFDEENIIYSDLEPDEEQNELQSVVKLGNRLLKSLGVKVVTHSAPEEEDDECEFDIRVTDVPEDVLAANTEPDLLEVRLATIGKDIWQRTPRKRFLASLLLIVLLVLFVSISMFGHTVLNLLPLSSVLPQATRTPGFTRGDAFNAPTQRTETNLVAWGQNNAVIVTARTIPSYCPIGVMLGQGRQIGNFPVWLSGIDSTTATIHLPKLVLKRMKGWQGWIVPLQIAGRYPSLTHISLTTFNMYNFAPPLFKDPYSTTVTSRLYIDAKHPMHVVSTGGTQKIGAWNIMLYIPSAGCYGISASWGQGSWMINFAAGQ